MPDIPQFAFPPRLNTDGTLAEVEQGSGTEIAQRVHILILTPPGSLAHNTEDPMTDFGLGDQAHLQGGADMHELQRQLAMHIAQDDLQIALEEDPEALNQALAVVDVRIGG